MAFEASGAHGLGLSRVLKFWFGGWPGGIKRVGRPDGMLLASNGGRSLPDEHRWSARAEVRCSFETG